MIIDQSHSTGTFTASCPYCGYIHVGGEVCPRIEEIEYYKNGQVKRIKLREVDLSSSSVKAKAEPTLSLPYIITSIMY